MSTRTGTSADISARVSGAADVAPGPGAEQPVRALVVDAHQPTRLGLALILRREPWVASCLMAADQRDAVALIRTHRPDVALVDISNVGPFVNSLASALRAAHPGLALVLSSRCGASAATAASVRRVDAGFLSAGATAAQVAGAVRAAVFLAPAQVGDGEVPASPLTARERQVLALLATGATNREIAAELQLGADSVKKHAGAIYRKLGVRNRTEATQRAATLLASG
ncbi:MAG: two component transcriptional regulator, LuxR family [Conexibacter sp.]|nr:two component transcriptional regulator, LuxR family [Conexibacter sp.]